MINTPRAGLDPTGRAIVAGVTPDLPGVFLSRKAACRYLSALPDADRKRYALVERGVRANHWNVALWLLVPKVWGAGRNEGGMR